MGYMEIVNEGESLFLLPPSSVEHILIWHQGALGDLLLAGPALVALSRHYPQARITGLGHPERWGLLAHSLPLAGVWDSGEAIWAHLFTDSPLPPGLRDRLAPFQLALAFTPKPRPHLLERLESAGIASAHWLPSFPVHCQESVAACQARRLAELGLSFEPQPFHLVLDQTREEDAVLDLAGPGPWVAVAPGSGHPGKNWPLSHYYELTRALAWQHGARVAWLAGPAEAGLLSYLKAVAEAQGHLLLADLPLARVATALSRCDLFIGGDSGLTHLAAAAGCRALLALFGPTDPKIWGPPGEEVRILTGPCPFGPCAQGREISCPESHCLRELAPETVLALAAELLPG